MEKSIVYPESGKKIRKYWLIASLVSFFSFPLLLLANLFFFPSSFFDWSKTFLDCLLTFGLRLLCFSICYLCAYKKPGTVLITLSLVLAPLSIFWGLAKDFTVTASALERGLYFSNLAVTIWWYVLSFKLRKFNKLFQMALVSSDPHMLAIKQALTVDALNEAYSLAVRNQPQYESQFTKSYQSQKMELEVKSLAPQA